MDAYLVKNAGRPIAKVDGKRDWIGIEEKEPEGDFSIPQEKKKLRTAKDLQEELDNDEEEHILAAIMRLTKKKNTMTKIVTSREKLSYIPNSETRETLYVSGPSGSGKSYFAANYATKYQKLFGNPIYLFSTKDEDGVLDEIKGLKRIPINENMLEAEIDYKIFADSLCIFDDVDSLENRKPLAKVVWGLRDTLLQNARSINTYVISTVHNTFGYLPTRTSLNESQLVVFFPGNGSDTYIEKYLKTRGGLGKDTVKWILSIRSRWIAFYVHRPRFILWEYGVKIL